MKHINKLPALVGGMILGWVLIFMYAAATHEKLTPESYYLVADSLGNVITIESLNYKTLTAGYHVTYLTPEQYNYAVKNTNHLPMHK